MGKHVLTGHRITVLLAKNIKPWDQWVRFYQPFWLKTSSHGLSLHGVLMAPLTNRLVSWMEVNMVLGLCFSSFNRVPRNKKKRISY